MAKYTHISRGDFALTDKDNPYSRINVETMFSALKDLGTMGAVKLWLYLSVRLNDEEEWDLSPKECGNSVGLKDDALRDAKRLMVKKGYLEDLGGDTYIFHQKPKEVETEKSIETKITKKSSMDWEF